MGGDCKLPRSDLGAANATARHQSAKEDNFTVVIIGGGLAGLMAAAHLAERGVLPLVLEADSRWPGGRLAGGDDDVFEYGGKIWHFRPDHGVHAVWGNYNNFRAALQRFTDTQLIPSTGEEWINRWKREVRTVEAGNAVRWSNIPAPFHYLQLLLMPQFWRTIIPLDFISLPGYLFSTLWAVGYDPLKERSALDGLVMKEFFRGWTPNLRATFRGLGANLLAAHESEIALTAYVAALRFYTILRRDAWNMEFFPRNSHDSLIAPLIDSINQNGGKLLLGSTVTRLERSAETWQITYESTISNGIRTVYADNVIVALNAPGAERLLKNSTTTCEEANRIPFPSGLRNVIIRLWFANQPTTGASSGMFTGDFVPDNFFWLHRLYLDEFAKWRASGGSTIELHFYGDDATLDLPDRNLIVLAVDEVQRAFPEVRGHFVYGVLRRNSKVHTRFRVPTADSLHVVSPWPNFYAAGDWIGFDTPSFWMERSTVTGIAAANAVLSNYGHDPYKLLPAAQSGLFVQSISLFVKLIRVIFSPVVHVGRRLRQSSP